uniref:Uncharacterized protein n=1 Tax=Magallana gigas TaxID=29159 RepID=K1PV93_MAGGI
MAQGPPLPHRSDSLPDYQLTPPIPPKPQFASEPQSDKKTGILKKMATMDQLNMEISVNQEIEWENANDISQCRAGAGLAFCFCPSAKLQPTQQSAACQLQCY